jgi:hypothetical protein
MTDIDPARFPAVAVVSARNYEEYGAAEESFWAKYDCEPRPDEWDFTPMFLAELAALIREKQAEALESAAEHVERRAFQTLSVPGESPCSEFWREGWSEANLEAGEWLGKRAQWYRDGCPVVTAEDVAGLFAVDRKAGE